MTILIRNYPSIYPTFGENSMIPQPVIPLPNASPKKVALVFPMTVSWLSVLAEGVADYARRHTQWEFTTSPPTLVEAQEIALTIYTLGGWEGTERLPFSPSRPKFARRVGSGYPWFASAGTFATAVCLG